MFMFHSWPRGLSGRYQQVCHMAKKRACTLMKYGFSALPDGFAIFLVCSMG